MTIAYFWTRHLSRRPPQGFTIDLTPSACALIWVVAILLCLIIGGLRLGGYLETHVVPVMEIEIF